MGAFLVRMENECKNIEIKTLEATATNKPVYLKVVASILMQLS